MKKFINAITTPLASIFGSGFLVIVPILAGAVGPYSVWAMVLVCAVAFAVGSVIRYNIKYAEPILANGPGEATLSLERASDLALVLAYVISVCLYLHILSAFVLTGLGIDSGLLDDILTTAVIVAITVIGLTKGLKQLEAMEQWALAVTLLIIFLLYIGFARYDWIEWQKTGQFALPQLPDLAAWQVITIVAGTLIVVQGFETSRYLGETYDAETRIKSSRWSQLFSSAIYIGFVALAMPLAATLNSNYNDNSLLLMTGTAAAVLSIPLILGAVMSQFSAAVADTIAAAGNLEETTRGHLKPQWGYLLVGMGAIALTWSVDTFEVIALASRAFAFYYFLQCLVAVSVSKSVVHKLLFSFVASIMGFVTIFAVPAG